MKKAILVLCGSTLIFLGWFFSVGVGEYPELDTCFRTTVSETLLCSQSPNYIALSGVSKYFLKAVVMSEDDKFYFHGGFDWKELRKSMEANFRQFAFVRGGSTITQQLVKNIYLHRRKTISRKIIEAKLAKKIEKKHSKKLILEKYVNAIEFGENLYGVKNAANFYFRKPPSRLSPVEALYLVILLPSPIKYSQTFFDKKLSPYQRKRMHRLLRRMKRRNILSPEEFDAAEVELSYFLKGPGAEDFSPDDIEVEEIEDAEVVHPEEGEMFDTEHDHDHDHDYGDSDDDSFDMEDRETSEEEVEPAEQIESEEEESYSEEGGLVEDEDPDYDMDESDGVEEAEDQP